MEEQDRSGESDYSGTPSTENLLADPILDPAPSPFRSFGEPERKSISSTEPSAQDSGQTIPKMKTGSLSGESPFRSKRLSEAFWEGVASAKSGSKKESPPKAAPPPPENTKPSDQSGSLDWVIQGGKSAASVIGQAASSLVDSVANLAKKTPAIPAKWGEAFREGAASVRRPEGLKPKTEPAPRQVSGQAAFGQGIWNSVSQIGETAAGFVRGALATFKPGEEGDIEKQIHLNEKKIKELYVEIGREAVEAWNNGGLVETEKIRALLEEFNKQEEAIRNLKAYSSEFTVLKTAPAGGIQVMAPQVQAEPEGIQVEAPIEVQVGSAPGIQEEALPEDSFSPLTSEVTVESGGQPVSSEAETIVSTNLGAESLTGPQTSESTVEAGTAVLEEDGLEAHQNLPSGTEGVREKTKEAPE